MAIASQKWGMSQTQIANEYELTEAQVREALSFYAVNKEQIDAAIASEQSLEIAWMQIPPVVCQDKNDGCRDVAVLRLVIGFCIN